jgi:copper(I)-binding protein
MSTENDVMRMRQITAIELPAKTTIPMTRGLKKDGYHVMLMGLKAPLKVGDKLPLKLTFEKAGAVEVVVNVEALKPDAVHSEHKH